MTQYLSCHLIEPLVVEISARSCRKYVYHILKVIYQLYCISRHGILLLDPLNTLSLLYYISMSEPVYKNDDSCILSQAIYLILIFISSLFIH
jgi:hypothetical protein